MSKYLYLLQVEVADPKYKVTNFGAVSIGQTVKKNVSVVNRSAAPVTCSLSLTASVPALQDPKVQYAMQRRTSTG